MSLAGRKRPSHAKVRSQLTFANIVSLLALFVALGGGAYAVTLSKNSVGAKQIQKNAVRAPEMRRDAVRSSEVKDFSLLAEDFKAGELPAGPPGVNGAANVTYRRASSEPLAQGSFAQMTVGCQPGERLIGGGAGFPFASGAGTYDVYEQLATSGPGILVNPGIHAARPINDGETPNVWYASGYQAEVNNHVLTVYAICATP